MKGFKEAGGTQPKNNPAWIRDFISFSNLVYICTKCKEVDKDVNDKAKKMITNKEEISNQLNNISVILDTVNKLSKHVAEVVARVEHVAASFGSHGLTDQAITQPVTDNNVKAHSVSGIKTYAAVTTANIPEVVMSVVETTLKSQRIKDQIECSLAFYNVSEETNDNVEISEILKLIECAIIIVGIKRIEQ